MAVPIPPMFIWESFTLLRPLGNIQPNILDMKSLPFTLGIGLAKSRGAPEGEELHDLHPHRGRAGGDNHRGQQLVEIAGEDDHGKLVLLAGPKFLDLFLQLCELNQCFCAHFSFLHFLRGIRCRYSCGCRSAASRVASSAPRHAGMSIYEYNNTGTFFGCQLFLSRKSTAAKSLVELMNQKT